MAVNNPPRFLNTQDHDAEGDRRMIKVLSGGTQGYVNTGDFAVSEGAPTSMAVRVAAGEILILGTESSTQGTYLANANTITVLDIDEAPGANSRIDIVVAQIEDTEYSGGTDAFSLNVITGVVSATPVAPAVPHNSLKLAEVTVATGVAAITNNEITDTRTKASIFDPSLLNPDAADMSGSDNAGRGLSVTTTQPSSPVNGDIWIDPS